MSQAYEVTPDDVGVVISMNWEKLDSRGLSFGALAVLVFSELDTDRVEQAALAAGTNLDDQTEGAYAEIAQILIEDGYLKPTTTDCNPEKVNTP